MLLELTDLTLLYGRIEALHGISIEVENLGPLANDGQRIARIVRDVDRTNFGTCPDWGNSSPEVRYPVLEQISPYAKTVHAKMYEFGPDGEESTIDVGRCLQMLRSSGYAGYLVMEYGGQGDQFSGVERGLALLRKHLDQPVGNA